MNYTTDCLIIGSGAAGLTLALGIADKAKVIVLSKEGACAGSTNYAQGGIAGVYNIKDDDDSIQAHIKDTCIAGGFLCDEKTVEFVAKNAHDAIQWLIDTGVPFDMKETEPTEANHLTTYTEKAVTLTEEFSTLKIIQVNQFRKP